MRIRKIISDAERTEKIDFAKERKSTAKAERTEKIDFAKERKSTAKAEHTEKIDFAKECKSHKQNNLNLILRKNAKVQRGNSYTSPLKS